MDTFDVFAIAFCTYSLGMLIGLFINNKKIKNLQEQVDAGDNSYMKLLDRYMELRSSHSNLMLAKNKSTNTLTKSVRRGPGRPKGSKNKPTAAKTEPKKRK